MFARPIKSGPNRIARQNWLPPPVFQTFRACDLGRDNMLILRVSRGVEHVMVASFLI